MKIERAGQHSLTPEEQHHLEQLRQRVRAALADGKVSASELEDLNRFIQADHEVTPEELQTIRETIREILGSAALEYDWE